MPPQALAAVATLLSFSPHGNRVELRLDHGAAEMVWVTPSTFRFRRTLDGPLPAVKQEDRAPVAAQIDEEPGLLRVRSKFLDVAIQKHGLLLRVRKLDGTPYGRPFRAGPGGQRCGLGTAVAHRSAILRARPANGRGIRCAR
ncbi:exported hypothetical protein [Candidatus Sulfopaludibacter sp. SbA6]|nr:exported hypothetical protein [Candidatus Sulfopaludibacter sp. SbA6]